MTTATKWPASETELCLPAIDWLRAAPRSYDVHQEVMPDYGKHKAPEGTSPIDLVCVKPGREIIAIEAKRAFCMDLIAQAKSRKGLAHFIVVLAPEPPQRNRACKAMLDACQHEGIGVLFVRENHSLVLALAPQRNPNPRNLDCLTEALGDSTRFNTAGVKSGAAPRFTRRDDRWKPVREYVAENDGCTAKDIRHGLPGGISKTEFNDLLKAAGRAEIPGIRVETVGGQMRFYLKEQSA